MAWLWMLRPDTYTGLTWVIPARTMVPLSERNWTVRIARRLLPEGDTFTPKQATSREERRQAVWCDREGMRVMRSNLDGSQIETLVDASQGDARPGHDQTKWCVGVAVDHDRDQIYWTQKGPDDAGLGRLFRANVEIPKGETAATARISKFCSTDCPSRLTSN